jgi:curli production assembly/transport component CsgG
LLRQIAIIVVLMLGGCAGNTPFEQPPTVSETTQTHRELTGLPSPPRPLTVAVYGYFDQTGQYKASENVQTLSRAVPQGGTSILIKALQDAGTGSWFRVLERERLDNLLRERQIVRETRARYEGDGDLSKNYLPPMLFAGMLLEGGIIAYDSNTLTGGAGAAYLGIGGSTQYREDTVTVYLRAVSTNTGEILRSVIARKTIFSLAVQASVFRYVGIDELLEIEAGFTTNEPVMLALKQAIEKAVVALVLEGVEASLWNFQDAALGAELVQAYRSEKQTLELVAGERYRALQEGTGETVSQTRSKEFF